MPWKFNPFTTNLDYYQSGGGASYIDGEVATYNDLPLDGTAALNTAWLVRTASGVWPVSRKQAGIYIRTATGGSNRDSDYTYAGTMPNVFSDSQFLLYDNTDTSKNLAFDLGNLPTETTRIVSGPAGNGQMLVEGQSIGGTTPAAVTATNLMANTRLALPSSAAGTPVAGDLYRVTDTLRYRDSSNAERLLLNATDNLSNLANTATARTNLGLGSSSAVTFGSLTANNGTLTASAPVLDLAQTWNNAAVAFTAARIDITNTASATGSRFLDCIVGGASAIRLARIGSIPYALFGAADTGIGAISSSQASIIANGGVAFVVNSGGGGAYIRSDAAYAWASSTNLIGATTDLILRRDAANTLAQYNGSNPQRYNLYGTYTSSTSFERLFLEYNSTATAFRIGTEAGSGGGTVRNLEIRIGTQTSGVLFSPVGSGVRISCRDVLAGAGYLTNNLSLVDNSGTWQCRNAANTADAPLTCSTLTPSGNIQFGGTTSSFPALKRSSATLQVRLADDSAYSVIDAQLRAQGTAPATSTSTGTAGDIRYDSSYVYICTSSNTWVRAALSTF